MSSLEHEKISKLKSVNEMVLEVSCTHLKLNIFLKISMAAMLFLADGPTSSVHPISNMKSNFNFKSIRETALNIP